MAFSIASPPTRGNHLLSRLSDDAYAYLAPMLQLVDLDSRQMLHERGQPFASHLYFPITSLVSVVVSVKDGGTTEIASVGNDGFTGAELLIGAPSAIHTYICQIPGQAMRLPVATFQQALLEVPELHRIANSYLQMFMSQTAQAGACNIVHVWEGRFARWLLQVQDRTGQDAMGLSRESMAEMLNVPHQNISLMAGAFHAAGLIQYQNGHLRILDREGLEEVSCECYGRDKDDVLRISGN